MWLAMTFTFLIVNNLPLVGKSFGHETQGIFLATTFVVLLGMADDRYQLDALTKLAGQALAAGILLIYGIQILWVPINGVITLPASIGQLVTVLIVLVTVNAVNFIDGKVVSIDIYQQAFGNFNFGKAAAESVIILTILLTASYFYSRAIRDDNE